MNLKVNNRPAACWIFFFILITVTHTQRVHAHFGTVGTRPLYQGRFKSIPIQEQEHFLKVCRHVERNPLRANLVKKAELWPWSSWGVDQPAERTSPLCISLWPVPRPRNWRAWVDRPQTEKEVETLRKCLHRGSPFGEETWTQKTAVELGLESSLQPRG